MRRRRQSRRDDATALTTQRSRGRRRHRRYVGPTHHGGPLKPTRTDQDRRAKAKSQNHRAQPHMPHPTGNTAARRKKPRQSAAHRAPRYPERPQQQRQQQKGDGKGSRYANRKGISNNATASTTAAAVTRGRGHPQQVDVTARGEQGCCRHAAERSGAPREGSIVILAGGPLLPQY